MVHDIPALIGCPTIYQYMVGWHNIPVHDRVAQNIPVHALRKPDVGFWFQRLKGLQPGVDVAVNLCGPRSLVDDARRAAADVSAKTGLFNFQEEVFEFCGTT
jgi:hypothetical protein